MPGFRRRSIARALLVGAIGLCAFTLQISPSQVLAKDLPPTAEGAQKLTTLFETYFGKPAPGGAPMISVTPRGGVYLLSFDLAAMLATFKGTGFSMDPAVLAYSLTEQDDGLWRVTGDAFPPISFHGGGFAEAFAFDGLDFSGLYDPALGMFKTGEMSLETEKVEVHQPHLDESMTIGPLKVKQSASLAANGDASMVAREEFAGLSATLFVTAGDTGAADPSPVPISIEIVSGQADIGLDGAPASRKLLDLWAFLVAHPSRAEIAANEPALKKMLRAFLPNDLKLSDKTEMRQLTVEAPQGAFGLDNGKFTLAAAVTRGPRSSVEYGIAASGIRFPAALAPPAFRGLIPTALDFDLKASGFDLGAGADEAINDLHFAGDGPVISPADGKTIAAKAKGAGPIVVDLLPSHIVAPQVDLSLEGQGRIEGERYIGSLKVHVRHFDQTLAALQGLGTLASPQLIGGLAMAKALAKTESDGQLGWVIEYNADGLLKVNGLALGKPKGGGAP